jgi:hypothetical protein
MRSLKIFALLVVLNTGAWMIPQEAFAQRGSVSFQLFYDELSPYGMWVNNPNYGYVWIPDGEPGFSPYATGGHWVFTDDGWTWFSDYPWGWATFHYGRWDYDDAYGWFWVPDSEWGPAWVSWRRSPGYYGWAPLRPGISVSIAFGRDYRERDERWIFVRDGDITRSDIGRHYVDRSSNVTIINNSTLIVNTRNDNSRNTAYITGPDRADVQRATHATVNPVTVREADKPGQHLNNGELQIYRPQVQQRNGNGRDPAPSRVMKLNEVRPPSERNGGNRQQQPPVVNPPVQNQPSQLRAANPPDNRGRQQQPPVVKPPVQNQPSQPRAANPSGNRGRRQQPPVVNAPNQGQPSQPLVASPPDNKGRQQQSRTVTVPNKGQPAQPRGVKPSDGKGKEKQPQNVPPPKKNDEAKPSQPKANKDEKQITREQ